MEFLRKKVVVIFVACFMLLSSVFALAVATKKTAYADPPSGYKTGMPYYFTDYYPTVSDSKLEGSLSSGDIFYDHQSVNEEEFADLVGGYFDWLHDCTVVIDIKTFKPSNEVLYELFSRIASCRIAFVTVYPEEDYYDEDGKEPAFMQYVDLFLMDDLSYLRAFIDYIYDYMCNGVDYGHNFDFCGTVAVLDDNLIDLDAVYGSPMDEVCAASPLVKILLRKYGDVPLEVAGLVAKNQYDLCILAGTTEPLTDIIDWDRCDSVTEARRYYDYNGYESISASFAIGIWELSEECYDLFVDLTQQDPEFEVFLLEADPFNYGPGLRAHTDAESALTAPGLELLAWLSCA